MNAYEKAQELIDKFTWNPQTKANELRANMCALIAVDEILHIDVWDWPHNAEQGVLYWEEVKEKIKSLL